MGDTTATSLMAALRRIDEPLPRHVRIACERILAGLTASQCARALRKSHTIWQRIESGEREVTDLEEAQIARILGVTVQRLRGEQPLAVPGWRKRGRPFAKPTTTTLLAGRASA